MLIINKIPPLYGLMLVNCTHFSFHPETIFNFGFTVLSIYVQPNEVVEHNNSFAELPVRSKSNNTTVWSNRIFEH